MADVARVPGLPQQIRLVAGLRWRILRNNLKNKNRRLDLIGFVIVCVVGALFVLGLCFALYAGAITSLADHKEGWLALLFWGIFLWWQVMPVMVAGFSPHFEFRSLLRFPMKFTAFYLIGLAYGFADSAALASLFWLTAMTLGVARAKPSVLSAMIVACALFAAINVTMERLLGSWLEKLLAKRWAHELFFASFILMIVGVQFIEPAMRNYRAAARPAMEKIAPFLGLLPASLAGRAVTGAALGDGKQTTGNLAGLAAYAIIFGGLLWLRFGKQYRGEELSETVALGRATKRTAVMGKAEASAAPSAEGLRLLPATVSAVYQKELRYLLRSSFSLIALLFPPMLTLLFGAQFGGAHPTALPRGITPDLFFPGIMAYLALILMAPAYNCFAFEGRGMQTYFMVPVRFRDVLLGKNLTQVTILGAELVACIALLAWRVGLPPSPVFLSTLAALLFAVAGQFTIANWSSLSFPKKMVMGRMRGQRNSGMAVFIAFAAQFVFAPLCGVVLFAGRWSGNVWLPMEIFVLLGAAAVGGYFASLEALTRLAEQKKEILIEALCR